MFNRLLAHKIAEDSAMWGGVIRLTGAREKIGRKAYIRATSYPQTAFDRALAECKADPTWKTFVNENTGHDVMIEQPQWLVRILMQVA